MRQLNGVYAQRSNRRHVRVGHLFEGRYKAVLVQEGEHFERALRYVVRNPVAPASRGVVDEWRWTSHRAMVGAARAGVVAGRRDALAPRGRIRTALAADT